MLALAYYWKPIAIAALLAATAAYRGVLIHQRDTARGQVVLLSAQAAQLEASNQAMSSAIAAQNAAVARLKANAERAAALAHQREQDAAKAGAGALDTAAATA